MHRRLMVFLSVITALIAVSATNASAAVTSGGPWAPNVFSVATIDTSTWYASTDRGVFRTADAGRSWQSVASFRAAPGGAGAPSSFAPLLVGYGGGVLYAISPDTTVGVSTDQGQTWKWHTHTGDDWGLIGLVVQPDDPSHLILTTGNAGTLVSSDGGVTWTRATTPNNDLIDNVVIPTGGNGIAWAIDGSDLLRSTDGGLTWSVSSMDVTGTGVYGLADSGTGTLFALRATSESCSNATPTGAGGLSVPQNKWQLVSSTDRGLTWSSAGLRYICSPGFLHGGGQPYGLVAHRNRVALLSSATTVAVSSDGGQTFTYPRRIPYATSVGASSYAGSDLVVGTNVGVVLITASDVLARRDGIQSWLSLAGIALQPGNPNTMLVSLADRGLYRTADAGATWSAPAPDVEGQLHPSSVIQLPVFSDATHAAFAVDAPGTVFTTDGLRVFSTADAGATWSLAKTLDGWEPGGSAVFTSSTRTYLPINEPYVQSPDTKRCGIGIANSPDLSDLVATSLTVDRAEPDCTRMLAVAADPTNPLHVIAVGEKIADTGVVTSWLYFRSLDGGVTWSRPTGLDNAFPTREWAPPVHVVYTGSQVLIWKSRSNTLCTSTDDGASFSCKEGAFATTPGGPGWVTGGYLSAFELQADGGIIASVVDTADWPDPNSTIPDAGVTMHLLRSVDGGVTWAVADQQESAAVTDVVDLTAGVAARAGRKPRPTGTRKLVLSSAGVFRASIVFKPAARGRASAKLKGIVVHRKGTVAIRVVCPKAKRCTGFLQLSSTGSFKVQTVRTAFDVTGSRAIVLSIPKAQRAKLRLGKLHIRLSVTRTIGGSSMYRAVAAVRR